MPTPPDNSQSRALTSHDRAELEKFRDYLRAAVKWDNDNDTLPDFAPISDEERLTWAKRRCHAHAAIYQQIYGEKP